MLVIDLQDTFIVDSIVHARNLAESNINIESEADPLVRMMVQASRNVSRGPILTEESVKRDWAIEDTARMSFAEAYTDVATYHPTPIAAFKDGFNAIEKADEALERWPDRFNVMASIDPLQGEDALTSLEAQVERLDPIGLKMYPYGWATGKAETWRMDDPNIAYPVIEKAKELGLEFIAIHKAIPLGRAPIAGADPSDVDVAAKSFPEIDFCIVHGGLSFLEQTSWQLFNFDNIYVDLEGAGFLVVNRPRRLAEILAGLVEHGGEELFERVFWSSGIPPRVHPKIQYEAFAKFQFPEEIQDTYGVTLSDESKRKMLGENYAEMADIDPDAKRESIEEDEFEEMKTESEGLPAPYSTIDEVVVEERR